MRQIYVRATFHISSVSKPLDICNRNIPVTRLAFLIRVEESGERILAESGGFNEVFLECVVRGLEGAGGRRSRLFREDFHHEEELLRCVDVDGGVGGDVLEGPLHVLVSGEEAEKESVLLRSQSQESVISGQSQLVEGDELLIVVVDHDVVEGQFLSDFLVAEYVDHVFRAVLTSVQPEDKQGLLVEMLLDFGLTHFREE